MSSTALIVGGCPAPYHRLEPAEPPIRAALEELGLAVTTTGIYHPDDQEAFVGDYGAISRERLASTGALVLYTTGVEAHGADVAAIANYVRQGGALVGIHNAADSFTTNEEYISLLGGRFRTHPAQLPISVEYTDAAHPITEGLEPFTVLDELYLFADYHPSRVRVLAQTRSYDDDGPVPICWVREEGSGRVFYLSLGHNPATLEDAAWRALFQRGTQWAMKRL
ncbi:MAG: ThuA domain-containing protein [Chthonomonadales bacterium]|nr:ThuA domain-containing protein [Chthonomonadales bacterium]